MAMCKSITINAYNVDRKTTWNEIVEISPISRTRRESRCCSFDRKSDVKNTIHISISKNRLLE